MICRAFRIALAVALLGTAGSQGVIVPIGDRRDHLWDESRDLLYVSTDRGVIERYSPTGVSPPALFVTPNRLNGFDITPAGDALYIADELFFTGTAAEVTPIRSVDKYQIGSGKRGPVTEKIQHNFFGILAGEIDDRHNWLTFLDEA